MRPIACPFLLYLMVAGPEVTCLSVMIFLRPSLAENELFFFAQDLLIDDTHENDLVSYFLQEMTYFDKYYRKAYLGNSIILIVEN